MKQVHIFITGRVQGVGFRYWTKSTAKKHGISGWVKNTQNGRVEIVAQGDSDKLRKFLLKLTKGPFTADVDTVSEEWEEVNMPFEGFKILR